MKLLLTEILEIARILEILTPNEDLRLSAAYPLRMLKQDLQKEVELFKDLREEVLMKCAEKDDEGNPIIKEGHYQLGDKEAIFEEDILELLNQEREVQFIPIHVGELGNPRISMQSIDKLIKLGVINEG